MSDLADRSPAHLASSAAAARPVAQPADRERRKTDLMYSALRKVFGFDEFRPGQETLISSILDHRDVVGVLPTGAGKSLCYELPALMLPGLTLVITPLISLMKDQVDGLNKADIPAAFVNSTMSYDEEAQVLAQAAQGRYRILYVAPERLNNPRFLDFACNRVPLMLVAVDEAHCVSQWGQDFRPAYLDIPRFIAQLPRRPIVAAFTATATPKAREDIAERLELRDPAKVMTTFDRPNLTWNVVRSASKADRLEWIVNWALNHADESGIVYCSTRAATEEVSERLQSVGVSARAYHGGMEAQEREETQDDFIADRTRVIVATNAFGMGIDKPDVRWVVHHNAPENIEAYYQEAGRAGRDGQPAQCVLLWMEGDFNTSRHFIETGGNDQLSREELETVRQHRRSLLKAMHAYCMTTQCLRNVIMEYFGEATHGVCGRCSNCADDGSMSSEIVDVTGEARIVCACVAEISRRFDFGFGTGKIVAVLRGSGAADLEKAGLTAVEQFGALSDHSERFIRDVMSQLVSGDYLMSFDGRFPTVGLGPLYRKVRDGAFSLQMKQESAPVRSRGRGSARVRRLGTRGVKGVRGDGVSGDTSGDGVSGGARSGANITAVDAADDIPVDEELFNRLRELRTKLARKQGAPAYTVFKNATLAEFAALKPSSEAEMLDINGVGPKSFEKYGQQFLDVISGGDGEGGGDSDRDSDYTTNDAELNEIDS